MPDIGPAEFLIIGLIVVTWALPIILIVLGVRWLVRRSESRLQAEPPDTDSALATLRQRYPRGVIDATEFEERKRTLGG
jgi:uncharacterized membrane protein